MVRAVKHLWNCNNPDDLIEETDIYTNDYINKILKSPVEGFNLTCEFCS